MTRDELYHLIYAQREVATLPEVTTRAAVLVPSTLSDNERSVRTTLTTEDAVPVYDWMSGRVVLETLIVAGAEFDDQTPLLRDHRQYSVDAILGSITEVRVEGDTLDGLLTFGEELDEDSEKIWRRVKQGHLRRVSVGYSYTRNDYVTITAGETQTVKGRSFTAPKDRDLRVVFRWELKEVSVVVIPADKRALMRAAEEANTQRGTNQPLDPNSPTQPVGTPSRNVGTLNENHTVDELLNFLRQHGLGADVNIANSGAAIAWARQNLPAEHHSELLAICQRTQISVDASQFTGVRSAPPATPDPPVAPTPTAPVAPTAPAVDPALAERQRQSAIRSLHAEHPTVPAEVVNRCLDSGLSIDAARAEFLASLRGSRQDPVGPVAPAAHIRGGITLRALQAGLMMKFGIEPDARVLTCRAAESVINRRAGEAQWIRGAGRTGEQRNEVEQAFDLARNHNLHNGSMMRFAEALVELGGERAPWNHDEILERAFSHANFNALFGTVVHIMMVNGYQRQANTYSQIARVIDVPDFRPNQEAMAGGVGRLVKQGKNGEKAALLNIDSPTLSSVTAERYAGLLKLTDQVFIADSFGVLNVLPEEVGASASAIPNDLVYSIVLGNPNLSDDAAFYVAGTNLIADGALDEEGLNAAGILLANKVVNGKRVVINGGVLLHGTTLAVKAKKIINNITSVDGDENVMRNSYRRLEDNVVDLGCTNPATTPEATIAGTPNSYYLFSDPLRSLTVAFRQGTNRGPVSRATQLTEGEWGFAWDVYVDCGAAATSRIGTVRVNQA